MAQGKARNKPKTNPFLRAHKLKQRLHHFQNAEKEATKEKKKTTFYFLLKMKLGRRVCYSHLSCLFLDIFFFH